jgi:hypothetical protein
MFSEASLAAFVVARRSGLLSFAVVADCSSVGAVSLSSDVSQATADAVALWLSYVPLAMDDRGLRHGLPRCGLFHAFSSLVTARLHVVPFLPTLAKDEFVTIAHAIRSPSNAVSASSPATMMPMELPGDKSPLDPATRQLVSALAAVGYPSPNAAAGAARGDGCGIVDMRPFIARLGPARSVAVLAALGVRAWCAADTVRLIAASKAAGAGAVVATSAWAALLNLAPGVGSPSPPMVVAAPAAVPPAADTPALTADGGTAGGVSAPENDADVDGPATEIDASLSSRDSCGDEASSSIIERPGAYPWLRPELPPGSMVAIPSFEELGINPMPVERFRLVYCVEDFPCQQ